MATKIYINTNADSPASAAVRSEIVADPVRVPDAVKGDKTDYAFALVLGDGTFDQITAADVYALNIGVGPMGGPALTSTTAWAFTTAGAVSGGFFLGYLDYSLSAVTLALGAQSYIDLFIEAQITSNATSHAHSPLQAPIILRNRVL